MSYYSGRRREAGAGSLIFGFIWGMAFSSIVVFMNQNYEMIRDASGGTPLENPYFLAALGFLAVSALAYAVMLLSGLLLALTGRGSPRRWRVLLSFLPGFAVGPMAGRLVETGIV